MPRAKKLSAPQQQAAQNEGKKAFETNTTENPERYYELRKAIRNASKIYNELVSQRHHLFCAQTAASTLEDDLQKAGLTAEASIVSGISAIVERNLQQLLPSLNIAIMEADKKYQEAMEESDREFPNG